MIRASSHALASGRVLYLARRNHPTVNPKYRGVLSCPVKLSSTVHRTLPVFLIVPSTKASTWHIDNSQDGRQNSAVQKRPRERLT